MDSQKRNRLFALLDPWVQALGYECIEIEWDQSQSTLIIYIDNDSHQILVDDCAKVSKDLNERTELDELFNHTYNLSVSSPGIERPLRRVGQFREAIGLMIKVNLSEKHQDRANGSGVLQSVSGEEDPQIIVRLEDGVKELKKVTNKENKKETKNASQGASRNESQIESKLESNLKAKQWSFPLRSVKKAHVVYDWDAQSPDKSVDN